MKKVIGYGALIVGIIDFFTFMFLMLSGNIVGEGGFTSIGAFCFVLWFACVFTVIFCLVIPFIKKIFVSGFATQNGNSAYCTRCGKEHHGAAAFCPHCGAKQ